MADAFDYVETGTPSQAAHPSKVTGAGNNPSTYAGVIVLFALATLALTRKSFRRYM